VASIFFPFHLVYGWLVPVDNGGHCTLFHKSMKHKHVLVTSEASICPFELTIHKSRQAKCKCTDYMINLFMFTTEHKSTHHKEQDLLITK
jgi:hypothetical protein